MHQPTIHVEQLAKCYCSSAALRRQATLRDMLAAAARGAWRPSRALAHSATESQPAREFWALQDLTFDAHPGEVLGIVGPNGSGKSTLLKILARVTEPTAGFALLRGRAGAMLEVGTGFHMELSGRENIYLSGAILGMRRHEIRANFQRIVDLSGVGAFLDLPVKRYSSGMYLRLAFSVACHLDTNVLLLDEVLAVGDLDFQRTCRDRIKGLAQEGRTIVLVSHDFRVVRELCDRVVVLESGRLQAIGIPDDVLSPESLATAA